MNYVEYVLSLINDKNEIVVDDRFKLQVAITIINQHDHLKRALELGVKDKVKLQ
jgi:hypothetical protein